MNLTESQTIRYRRDRNSSWLVRVSDRIAKQVITIGGIGTILVVMLVVLVLLGNVLPMFQANSLTPLATITLSDPKSEVSRDTRKDGEQISARDKEAVACGVDEFSEILWVLHRGDYVTLHSIATGNLISSYVPKDSSESSRYVTTSSVADNDSSLLAGYSDGTVRPITLSISVSFVKASDLSESLSLAMNSGMAVENGALYRKLASGIVRKQTIDDVVFHKPIPISTNSIQVVDWRTPQAVSSFDDSQTWAFGATDGKRVTLSLVENKVNSFSGEITQESTTWTANIPSESKESIIGLMVGARTEQLETLDSQGRVVQWIPSEGETLREGLSHLSLAGTESHARLATPLLGRSTLMIGSDSGHIESVAMTATSRGQELMSIHRFAGDLGTIESIEASPEGRLVAAAFASGQGAIYYVPTNQKLIGWNAKSGHSTSGKLFFSANAGSVGWFHENQIELWRVAIPFPEASLSSFFGRVWYEGYESPQYVWQSSTGTVEGEYKFGFMPLIFGTLKATFYSMLIGAPIALMAAVFGSEFMSRRWRARVKPFIELMASVPSVVLGFIGALVLAPILRDNLMFVLMTVVCILFLFVLAAHLWMIVPGTIAIRFRSLRLPILFLMIPFGVWTASTISPFIERSLFQESIVQWLSGHEGTGWSGWFCLALLPVSVFVTWMVSSPLSPIIQTYARSTTPFRFSLINLGLFGLSTLAVLVIAAVAAWLVSAIGWDPRGSVLGPYQERNALLVGAILGFAIIPLIYTISEDALQSVPQHLRSASLGCGATTWQTTIRVVVPTAMSGLFSALMIGFGRAVGETMVVLMAAGNTPVMDINPMNGYRTLSANLATELPEAARGSTHFHALFLAAFLLFCFTMVANTIAEVVRMRFRKRAFQL